MARTDAQPSRAARGLMVLGNDCVHKVMTFLAVVDARRGVGSASKSLRTTAMSTTLSRTRFYEPYTLRGDKHGVVHAMATACGTRQWPTRMVQRDGNEVEDNGAVAGAVPPAGLGITIHRVHSDQPFADEPWAENEPYTTYRASGIVDQDVTKEIDGGGECGLATGTWLQYELPFQLQVTAFSFGFADCGTARFVDWTFEAFDGEEWRELRYSADSPWPGTTHNSVRGRPVVFGCHAADFGSTRFRIRLAESDGEDWRCIHIRGLELFGTILPPWRID